MPLRAATAKSISNLLIQKKTINTGLTAWIRMFNKTDCTEETICKKHKIPQISNNLMQTTYKLWQNGHMTGNKIRHFLDGSATCRVCNGEIETPLHTFWYCKPTQEVYRKIQKILDENNIQWRISKEEAILGVITSPGNQVTEKNLLLVILRHNIWKNRNRATFEGSPTPDTARVTWLTFHRMVPRASFLLTAPGRMDSHV